MNIAFVVNQLALGGAERQAADLAKALSARGHTCALFTYYGRQLLREELETAGVEVIPLDAGRTYWRGIGAMRRALRERRVDIVNSHMSLAGVFARLSAWLAHIPAVSVEQLPGDCEPFRARLIRDLALNGADAIVCISHEVRRRLYRGTNWYLVRRPPIFVIYNTIDRTRISEQIGNRTLVRKSLDLADDDVILVNVGRYHEQKGQTTLLRALPSILVEEPRARVVLVGWGPMEAHLRSEAARLGVGDHVIFARGRADAVSITAASDLFVFPSRYEGLGIALLEAMSVGTPVVASRIAPITEVVRDELDGLLVSPEQPGELAKTILRALGDKDLREILARSAELRVAGCFDLKTATDAYESLFEGIVRR